MFRTCFVLLFLSFGFVFPQGGMVSQVSAAEKMKAEKNLVLDEVFVSATKEEQLLRDIPQSVGSVKAKEIDLTTTNGLHEVLQRIPGVTVKNRFGSDDVIISIRGSGIRSNFGVRGAFVLVDGIPLTEPDGQTRLDVIDLASVERVEVVRGPASTVYGGNTSGGVINLITKKGETPGTHMDNRLTVGSFGFVKGYVSAYGGNENHKYFVGASHTQKDGYRLHSNTEGQRFNGNVEFKLDERSTLKLMAAAVSVDIRMPGTLTAAQFAANPTQAQARNTTNDFARFDDRFRMGMQYNRELSQSLTGTITGYWDWRRLDHPIFQYLEIDRIATGGDFRLNYNHDVFGHENEIIGGYSVQYQSSDEQRYVNSLGQRGALTVDQSSVIDNQGVYFQDQFTILPDLKFTGGVRWNRVQFRIDDDFLSNGNQSGFRDVEEVVHNLGLNYSPLDELTLYTNYSRGFETPTESEFTSSLTGGFVNLQAMIVDNYEIGARGLFDVMGMPFNYQLAYYHTEFDNFILGRTVGFRTTFSNAGAVENDGFEAGLGVDITPTVHFETTYTFSDFEFTAGTFTGNDVPGQTPHQVLGVLDKTFLFKEGSSLVAGAEVRWSDDYFLDDVNTVVNSDWTTLALRMHYKCGQFGTFLRVDNVTDLLYSDGGDINGAGGRFFRPADGRAFSGGVTWQF